MSIPPALVGSIGTMNAYSNVIIGNYAYVAVTGYGLKIIDISNKTRPILVGNAALLVWVRIEVEYATTS